MKVGMFHKSLPRETLSEKSLGYYRLKYGLYKGYHAWDLACSWFQTDNDTFYRVYGFNYVPRGKLYEEAMDYVHNTRKY